MKTYKNTEFVDGKIKQIKENRYYKIAEIYKTLVVVISGVTFILGYFGLITWTMLIYPIPAWLVIIVISILLIFLFRLFRLYKSSSARNIPSIQNYGMFCSKLHDLIKNADKEIIIVNINKDWAFNLILTLYLALKRGVEVTLIYAPPTPHRYKLLKVLGCRLYLLNKSVYLDEFVVIDSNEPRKCRGLVRHKDGSDEKKASFYFGVEDHTAIKGLKALADELLAISEEQYKGFKSQNISIEEVKKEVFLDLLKKVTQYDENCLITYEEIDLENTVPLQKRVLEHRLKHAEDFFTIMKNNSGKPLPKFPLCGIKFGNNAEMMSLILPPVLEEYKGKLCVYDGHHKLYLCREKKLNKVNCIVVRGVTSPLPESPKKWKDVERIDGNHERRSGHDHIRDIEKIIHKPMWKSVERLLNTSEKE